MSIQENYNSVISQLPENVSLVVVSKKQSPQNIEKIYDLGQRDFGENKVQELLGKREELPQDIKWHCIGHLQTNKVKQIVPLIHLIHSVDSPKLLQKINTESQKIDRRTAILLQIKIATEETKYGLIPDDFQNIILQKDKYPNIVFRGVMGMATNTLNTKIVTQEFKQLFDIFSENKHHFQNPMLSMGMSNDYQLAIQEGANMLRLGSVIFR